MKTELESTAKEQQPGHREHRDIRDHVTYVAGPDRAIPLVTPGPCASANEHTQRCNDGGAERCLDDQREEVVQCEQCSSHERGQAAWHELFALTIDEPSPHVFL